MNDVKNENPKDIVKDRVDLFPVFKTIYELVLEFEKAHAQFPKIHKFSVGKRTSTSLVVTLEKVCAGIVEESIREASLIDAIVELEKTRILIRLAHDLKAIDTKRYERFSRLIVEALMQVTALLKAAQKRHAKSSEIPHSPK